MDKKIPFEAFLDFFPAVDPPISITDELVHVADSTNKVLPKPIVEQYIIPIEPTGEIDEFTEFVPILRIANTDGFYALIYWKGQLMKSDYILATFTEKGELITRRPIASLIAEENIIKKSAAHIDEDLIIHIVAGANKDHTPYDPSNSRAFSMEILPTGDVIFSMED